MEFKVQFEHQSLKFSFTICPQLRFMIKPSKTISKVEPDKNSIVCYGDR